MPTCRLAGYEIDLSPLASRLLQDKPNTIIVQLPDGLKHIAPNLVSCISSKLGVDESLMVIHGDSVFGACDLQLAKLSMLGDALVVHVGHTPYPPELGVPRLLRSSKVVFLPARSTVGPDDLKDAIREAAMLASRYSPSKTVLVSTSQHTQILPMIRAELEALGIQAHIPRGTAPYFEDGQVIGCDYRVARGSEADLYIIVSGGVFHPLGLYLSTLRPVIQLDPYRREAVDITPLGEKVYRRRLYLVSKAMEARSLALIIGLKEGQLRPWLVRVIERKAAKRGVKVYRYAIEYLTPLVLGNIDSPEIGFFTVTSCPRLPIDDFPDYHKPVLTPGETLMALEGRLEPYRFPW